MKKVIAILLSLCFLCFITAGCANKEDSSYIYAQDSASSHSMAVDSDTAQVDIDLTALNSLLVYAEVYNMMTQPNNYIGKTIKMSGPYTPSYYEVTDTVYHYVIIEDATACCAQGIEFIWKGEHAYPEDYPQEQQYVELVGVFGSYDELGTTYYYLSVDDISVL